MTILVKSDHPAHEQKLIASQVMSYANVHAEQVGFIQKPSLRQAEACLRMAGGEFCGNACMALAVYLASGRRHSPQDWTEVKLEASGTERLIVCQVKREGNDYSCQVAMPLPGSIERRRIHYEGEELELGIIRYEQCIHIVLEVDAFSQTVKEKAQSLAKLLGITLGANLIAILLFRPDTAELAPLIYVPALDSLIWERGCGSGTASIGAYFAWTAKQSVSLPVKQPGGAILVTAQFDDAAVTGLTIEGKVDIVAEGRAFIKSHTEQEWLA
ncbi:diaminopimelate epimerase [Paenibacillus phyllosphaerae]|nr:diaminopimelate epimerase [Paenibacillus phyllosphaerae]